MRSFRTFRAQEIARPSPTKTLVAANTIMMLALVVAFIFLVVLFRNNLQLTKETMALKAGAANVSGTIVGPPSVELGDIVPSFEAVSIAGQPTTVRYDGSSKYLLYLFSVRCSVCEGELPKWNQIASRAKVKNHKVFGLSIDSEDAKGELSKLNRDFDLLLLQSKPVQRAYRAVAIPLVMFVSAEGTVEWVQYGALSNERLKDILSLIDESE